MRQVGRRSKIISSLQGTALETDELIPTLERLLGRHLRKAERIPGGKNALTFRVTGVEGPDVVAKIYFRSANDSRDRLKAEFEGLRFLWTEGVRRIPEPFAADRDQGVAVYQYIAGERVARTDIGPRDIDEAVEFLGGLRRLCGRPSANQIGPASEACFSLRETMQNIEVREARFPENPDAGDTVRACRDFLRHDFAYAKRAVFDWCADFAGHTGLDRDRKLVFSEKTLSPSDFGFHNALRGRDGRMVFLDFEYFGWDDPAKMAADFLLHPGMNVSRELGCRFVDGFLKRFNDIPRFRQRLEVSYPLYGLKWCMILLNEFVPQDHLRRRFTGGIPEVIDGLRRRQLHKARQLLKRIMDELEHFPYYG